MKPGRLKRRQQNVASSFNHAYQGIIYVIRTQRNMQIHTGIALVVLTLSLLLNVSRVELAILVLVIMAVLVTEMFNTAMEFAVDLVTREYHPLAKLAKDVAAGAVLISSISAVAVGYLILADRLGPFSLQTLEDVRAWPGHLTLVALVMVALLVVAGKALTRSPNAFLGGMPSGHAAASFAGWVAVSFLAADTQYGGLISLMALMMALLVCQSRVEAGIHTVYQIIVGGVLGAMVTLAIFQLA